MRIRIFLLSVLMLIAVSAADFCPPTPSPCVGCEEIGGAPSSDITLVQDEFAHTATAYLYFENISASGPPRQALNFTTVIVNVYNETPDEGDVYKIYTDANGTATFDFSSYSGRCVTIGFLYCPFTCSDSPDCGFQQCLNFSGIGCPPCNVSAVPEAGSPTGPLKCYKLLPSYKTTEYCPPPEPLSATPEICFPLVLIFALLGGALFLSGVNPFTGFDFSAPRIGRHIIYQPRGRGVTVDLLQAAKIGIGAAREKKGRAAGGPTRKEATGGREYFWQPPKGRATVQGLMARRKAKATAAAMKKMPQYQGIGGFFRGLGAGLTTLGLAAVQSSFIGQIFSTFGINIQDNKVISFLNKVARVFPSEKQVALADFKLGIQGLKDLGITSGGLNIEKDKVTGEWKIRGADGKLKPLTVMVNGREAKVIGLDVSSLGTGLTCVLRTTDKEGGPVDLQMANGQLVAFKSSGVTFNITKEGAAVPVSMEVGGKTISISKVTEGTYSYTNPSDGKLYTASLDSKGNLNVYDAEAKQKVASPAQKFGLDFAGSLAIAMSEKGAMAPVKQEDVVGITKQLGKQVTHQITINTPQITKMFGKDAIVKADPTDPEGTTVFVTTKDGNTFKMGGGEKTAEGYYTGNKVQAAYGKDGKSLKLDKAGRYSGTNVKPKQNADDVVNQYKVGRDYLANLGQMYNGYKGLLRDEAYGRKDIVASDKSRFKIENNQVASAVDASGNAIQLDASGRFKGTKVRPGMDASAAVTELKGRIETTPGLINSRPEIVEATQNIATLRTGDPKSDRVNMEIYLQGAARLSKPLYDQITAGKKTQAQKSKAVKDWVKSKADMLTLLPYEIRNTDEGRRTITQVLASDADSHLKYITSLEGFGEAPGISPEHFFKMAGGSGSGGVHTITDKQRKWLESAVDYAGATLPVAKYDADQMKKKGKGARPPGDSKQMYRYAVEFAASRGEMERERENQRKVAAAIKRRIAGEGKITVGKKGKKVKK